MDTHHTSVRPPAPDATATAIAVLGAGNGGMAMAADLSLAGHRVVVCELPDFAEKVAHVAETRTITLEGMGRTGDAVLADLVFDVGDVLQECDLLNIVVPAFGQKAFFEAMLPCLESRHTVVVWAGDFGSLELRALLRSRRPDLSVQIVETNTLPYGARIVDDGRVQVSVLAPRVLAAALPTVSSDTATPVRALAEIWPVINAWDDVISVALNNPNPIVHPPGTLLNVGRIQYSGGEFNLYREGITEAVARVIRRAYQETTAVATALGARMVEYDERDFRTKTSIMGAAFQAAFDTDQVIGDIRGPKTIHDRYVTEDLPFGLVPISELGDLVDVDTPLIDSLIVVGSIVCGRDFWSEGRGLAALGIEGLNPADLIATVRSGVALATV